MSSWNWIECHWFLEEAIKEIISMFHLLFCWEWNTMKDVPSVLNNLSPRRNSWCLPLRSLNIAVYVQHVEVFSPNIFGARSSFWKKKKKKRIIFSENWFLFWKKEAKSISVLRNVKYSVESSIILIFLSFLLACIQPSPSISATRSHGTASLELFKGIPCFWFASNAELKRVWLGRNKPNAF